MKIFEDTNEDFGYAFKRISRAMRNNSPETVEWVGSSQDADVVILHVVGGEEFEKLANYDRSKVIMYQHCLHTTGISVEQWEPFWNDCRLVVSWNDMGKFMKDKSKFVSLPLGADPEIHSVTPAFNKNIDIFATGHVAETENIDDIYEACKDIGKVLHHTGHNFRYSPNWYKFHAHMDDQSFSSLLSKSKYIAGLREIEGFEMSCIEGAMTGSVPIVPNLPTYKFYKDFAKFVDLDENLKESLKAILTSDYEPLTEEQVKYVRHEFDWKNIMNKFFKEIV